MADLVTYHLESGIATVTLNAPEVLNAMDEKMGEAFSHVLKQLKKEKEARVVILTGAGRAFSAGGNLDMIEGKIKKGKAANKKELKKFYQTFLDIRSLPMPVIGAINGHAIGAGFCLALACDLRYASSNAKMGANFARIGLAPGMGGSYLITHLAGATFASEILFLAENLSAERALEMGLLNGVQESDQLMSHVHAVAKVIAGNGPSAIRKIKRGIQMVLEGASLSKIFDYDSTAQAEAFTTQDIREGVLAIKEKRSPRFKGL